MALEINTNMKYQCFEKSMQMRYQDENTDIAVSQQEAPSLTGYF